MLPLGNVAEMRLVRKAAGKLCSVLSVILSRTLARKDTVNKRILNPSATILSRSVSGRVSVTDAPPQAEGAPLGAPSGSYIAIAGPQRRA